MMVAAWTLRCTPMRCIAISILLLLLGGCGFNRQLARQADGIVAAQRSRALTCERSDHCAIASPFQQLATTARAQSRADHPAQYVDLLEQGEDALLARVHLIRAARQSIDIQTYIWAEDDAGWLILDELLAAARRGVHVRVLADQLFFINNVDWLAKLAVAHVNFEVRLFNPTFHDARTPPLDFAASILCCFSRFNQRMHNKLMLIDGEIGIAGGRNYENRYFDWDEEFDYRDREVLVVGTATGTEMQRSFERFWNYKRAVPLTRLNDVNKRIVVDAGDEAAIAPPELVQMARIEALRKRAIEPATIALLFVDPALRVGSVEYFSDPPDKQDDPDQASPKELTERISKLLRSAQTQVLLQTPYLVFSDQAEKILRDLNRRSPPVRVQVSTNSLAATDAFFVYARSYKHKKLYLRRLGLEIHEFKPFPGDAEAMIAHYDELSGGNSGGRYRRYERAPLKDHGVRIGLHAKSMVIDDEIALIGSHNFDPRSDHYNTESGVIIRDRAVAGQLRTAILRDSAPQNAWVIARRERVAVISPINNLIADISNALPIFDLWPFRYATSFELRPGCQPLPPRDPGFYACYEAVGDFPGVDLPLKTIYTRIITAFGLGLEGML